MNWLDEDVRLAEHLSQIGRNKSIDRQQRVCKGLKGQFAAARILAERCPKNGQTIIEENILFAKTVPFSKLDVPSFNIDFKDSPDKGEDWESLFDASQQLGICVSSSQVDDTDRADDIRIVQSASNNHQTELIGWCYMGDIRTKGTISARRSYYLLSRNFVRPIDTLVSLIES